MRGNEDAERKEAKEAKKKGKELSDYTASKGVTVSGLFY